MVFETPDYIRNVYCEYSGFPKVSGYYFLVSLFQYLFVHAWPYQFFFSAGAEATLQLTVGVTPSFLQFCTDLQTLVTGKYNFA